jgi:chemotaxis protein MotB
VPDSPVNRRISIIVMNRRTEEAILHENGSLLSVQHGTGNVPVNASISSDAGAEAPATADAAPVAVAEPVAAEPVASTAAP